MKISILFNLFIIVSLQLYGQADNEIQVYSSPTVENKWTIFELHNNYTFKGSKLLSDPKTARWTNETLEITHGFGNNFEVGFYTFTALSPDSRFQYLGTQIRPRVTVPEKWKWPFGASLSMEFGFFRPETNSPFIWQGEIRPIIDQTAGNWYFSFNPNLEFVISGTDKHVGLAPQFKSVYTIKQAVGVGIEYYGSLGTFKEILPASQQEHLLGPMIDLYIHPMWEFNGGILFGQTDNSNQRVIKILIGRRIGK